MKNLYVFFDTIAGNCGQVFEAENDLVMRRSALRALASAPPEIARDTVVLKVGSISYDDNGAPHVSSCDPARTVLLGNSFEVEQLRAELMAEARSYFPSSGGESDEE